MNGSFGIGNDLTLPQSPGQYEQIPAPISTQTPIKNFSAPIHIPYVFWVVLLTLTLAFLSRYRRMQKYVALILGGTAFLWIEVLLDGLEYPTLSETQPLFSFIDWKYEPYQKIQRQAQEWWVSEGGPARWQEVTASQKSFTIATLGASSAHGSNLLQEETFSAQLAQRLQRENPSLAIQIINLGIGGTTSNGVLYSGKQAIKMGADGLVIYYGHNEIPQFQQLSEFEETSFLSTRLFLSQLRLYSFLHRMLPTSSNTRSSQALSTAQLKNLAILNHRHNIGQLLQVAKKRIACVAKHARR